MYFGDPNTSFDEAQANQHDYLLDQIDCEAGSRLLDVGCGYGTLLARATTRGAKAVGITLSREQTRRCRQAGLDVRTLDYKALGPEWDGAFDGVVANGSLEHFAQPKQALAGQDTDIYRGFFERMHHVLDPDSAGTLVTTAIHFVRRPNPADLLRHPLAFPRGSASFHYAILARSLGGWYPVRGQLERCAAGYFSLVNEVDGTEDYLRTSEEWLRRVRQALRSRTAVKIAIDSLPVMLLHPVQFTTMLVCMLVTESWHWQFRPPDPPARLLRQTWQYLP
jgi:cyclopropane-fatty-acyl-phospholipid synthase